MNAKLLWFCVGLVILVTVAILVPVIWLDAPELSRVRDRVYFWLEYADPLLLVLNLVLIVGLAVAYWRFRHQLSATADEDNQASQGE